MKQLLVIISSIFLSMSLAQASLSVSEQNLMGHTVSIDTATLEQDGFIVVHAFDTEGELVLTPPLGVMYLEAGSYTDIMIDLDPMLLEENAYGADAKNVLPMIHVDANANQAYEFPEGGDVPVMVNDAMVVAELAITYSGMMAMMDITPALMVSPQTGSTVAIDSAVLAEDGFIVVHAFDINGELILTPPLGVVYLEAGSYENIMIELDEDALILNAYGLMTKDVLPMLHIDANANQSYEFPEGDDVPVMLNEEMVIATLELSY